MGMMLYLSNGPLSKFVIFDQKVKNMGSLGDKFVIFDQKLETKTKNTGPLDDII